MGEREMLMNRFRRSVLVVGVLQSLLMVAFAPAGEEPITVSPAASHCHARDSLEALADGKEPKNSDDHSIPRFTFWSHRGTTEWVQYDFDRPADVSSVEVYWFDDGPRRGGCRVPAGWKLFYQNGYDWEPVEANGPYGVKADCFNKLSFQSVCATGLRIEVRQQPGRSSGVLEWKVNGRTATLGKLGRIGPDVDALAGVELPRVRLALSALVEWQADGAPAAKQTLTELDKLTASEQADRLGARKGDVEAIGRLRQLGVRMAALLEKNSVKAILTRLDKTDPNHCMELAARLDWLDQDLAKTSAKDLRALARAVIDELGSDLNGGGERLRARAAKLSEAKVSSADSRWLGLYIDACLQRRAARLNPHMEKLRRVVFTKHHDLGGQHYAYTEDVSDSPYNDNDPFPPTGKLCLLEMDGLFGTVRTLIDEPNGIIRDPDVSHDGRRILFAWRKSMTEDDYHLYEMTATDGKIRQLTSGSGVADFEPAYMPDGQIVFNSSRCQQIVDCWWADVSNLFTCDGDGRYLRRLGYDQVHTNYPQVLPDGRVVYTRWDYNDRGQLFPQPLFVMNPDGTAQTEFYGNNSWFPTTILHARGIPGTQKIVCVLSGHHTYQKGKLAIIDPNRGRQENAGVQLIAPVRKTDAVKVDMYGYQGHQFQYPFALSQTEFLVTFNTVGSIKAREGATKPFGVFYVDIDGNRELLAADPKISCSQAVPLAARPKPPMRPSRVDYAKTTGTYFLQDIYHGPGLAGVPRGTIKRIRVVALEFRAAGVGSNSNRGPAGGALVSTPISINGAWDVKRVLGTAQVHEDGSAAFIVPARTPVYFQALDGKNHVVQTMRSWSTLQPGETFSCVGCHEDKNSTPPAQLPTTLAMRVGPRPLESYIDGPAGFSFIRGVQPILDKHCTNCHNRKEVAAKKTKISLEATGEMDKRSLKRWSDAYRALADEKYTSWVSPQSVPNMLPPYSAGAAKSRLIELLEAGHEDVKLSAQEMDRIACWIDLAVPFCGEYTETMDPQHVATYQKYLDKRRRWEAEEAKNIEALMKAVQAEKP